jgi:hypothetical protein
MGGGHEGEWLLMTTESPTTPTFEQGVVWACARLVEMYDQPTMAASILREAMLNDSDLRRCAEYDLAILRVEIPGLPKGKQ